MNVYQIKYTHAAINGQLRNGSIIKEAANPDAAKLLATEFFKHLKFPRITAVTLYAYQNDLPLSDLPPPDTLARKIK